MRTMILALLLGTLLAAGTAQADHDPGHAVLYKSPYCGCCAAHAKYLRAHGFTVDEVPTHELTVLKDHLDVPREMAGCHTTVIDGYVVEGHVHVDLINRLLTERPTVTGISLPGMPTGSPGMPGPKPEPLKVYSFGGDGIAKFGEQ